MKQRRLSGCKQAFCSQKVCRLPKKKKNYRCASTAAAIALSFTLQFQLAKEQFDMGQNWKAKPGQYTFNIQKKYLSKHGNSSKRLLSHGRLYPSLQHFFF